MEDVVTFDSVFDPDVVSATSGEAPDKMQRHVIAAADHGCGGRVALKRRGDPEVGVPPACKQRLLHERKGSNDSVKPDVAIDLQVVILPFYEASDSQRGELCFEAHLGLLHKVR